VDLLVFDDSSRLHELAADGVAPFVIEIGVRHPAAMDLSFRQCDLHSDPSSCVIDLARFCHVDRSRRARST
jgi:hypothetical protein